LQRGQLRREVLARNLEHAVSLAVFAAEELHSAGVDVHALEDVLLRMRPAVSNLRSRIEAFAERVGDEQP
jgi:hypothetical protein